MNTIHTTYGKKIILQGIVGSRAYGLDHIDSDTDRLGIFVTPTQVLVGLDNNPNSDTHVFRGEEGDVSRHEVGKFCRLALSGNPSVLELLFLPEYEILDWYGDSLVDIRRYFLSKKVFMTYGGYALDQLARFKKRGDGTFNAQTGNRSDKHARHIVRLLIQGEELLRTGEITVRLTEKQQELCWSVMGLDYPTLEKVFNELHAKLVKAHESTKLPDEPKREIVNNVLLTIRGSHYFQD